MKKQYFYIECDHTKQGHLKKEIKEKSLPQPGFEPESSRPQRDVLTTRPSKDLPVYNLLFRLSQHSNGSMKGSLKFKVLQCGQSVRQAGFPHMWYTLQPQ